MPCELKLWIKVRTHMQDCKTAKC
uniref:Uncharacterized protein n=1 Tax=Arundo donax TaxID=35708 RepID=A0A0A9B7P7_ARUDO